MHVPISTVQSIIKKYIEFRLPANMPRAGRPRKISHRTARKIVRTATINPRVTRKDLQKQLSDEGVDACLNTVSNTLHEAKLHGPCADDGRGRHLYSTRIIYERD